MYREHLKWLRCPQCGGSLELSEAREDTEKSGRITSARLLCPDGHSYQVLDGVPRLLADESWIKSADGLESFNFQYGLESRIILYDLERVRRIVKSVFSLKQEDIRDKVVYVIGCGNGAELKVLSEMGAHAVIGIDLTSSIVDAERNTCADPAVCVIQADALNPPFEAESFDVIYSDGVLPHTPDPLKVLSLNLKLLRMGGEAYVRTLLETESLKAKIHIGLRSKLRSASTRISPRLLWVLCWFLGVINQIPGVSWVARKAFLYEDPWHRDIWTTRLVNFRMYGRHQYRRAVSRKALIDTAHKVLPHSDVSVKGSILVVRPG